MAVFNFSEKLLLVVKQKSALQSKLTDIQMRQLAATRQASQEALNYTKQVQDLYYNEEFGYGTEEYSTMYAALSMDYQAKNEQTTAWENQLDLEKESIETQLNELTQFESTWNQVLKKNIQTDFTYGQVK